MTLRVYTIADAAKLQEATVESYEHLKPWMPWASETQTIEQTEHIVCRLLGLYFSKTDFTLGIWDGKRFVGGTGFHLRGRPVESKTGEIGMWIRASSAGQGWGTRVLEQMLEWGFTEWGWERLFWHCDTNNMGSARVAEKCGMTLEGTNRSDAIGVDGKRRDTHQYAMIKSEWLAR